CERVRPGRGAGPARRLAGVRELRPRGAGRLAARPAGLRLPLLTRLPPVLTTAARVAERPRARAPSGIRGLSVSPRGGASSNASEQSGGGLRQFRTAHRATAAEEPLVPSHRVA